MFNRIEMLRIFMREHSIDFFLIHDTCNIRWLTNFYRVFDAEQAHLLIVSMHDAIIYTDSRYFDACKTAAKEHRPEIAVSNEFNPFNYFDHIEVSKKISLGIEDSLTINDYRKYKKKLEESTVKFELHVFHDCIKNLRATKDSEEIRYMKKAQAITDKAWDFLINYVQIGMSELQVQRKLDEFMFDNGADGLAFDSIVSFGANTANPHARPGSKILKQGEVALFDFGARYFDYCSDMTRCMFAGSASELPLEIKKSWQILQDASELAYNMIKPGINGNAVHDAVINYLNEHGFKDKMGHSLGHGLGLEVHENPCLSSFYCKPLVENSCITVEPGIYFPGKFGLRLEVFGQIIHGGFDIFTHSLTGLHFVT